MGVKLTPKAFLLYVALVFSLGFLGMIISASENTEKGMIRKARQYHSAYDYEDYLKNYPSGKYVDEACIHIAEYYSKFLDEQSGYSLKRTIEDLKSKKEKYGVDKYSACIDSVITLKVEKEYSLAQEADTETGWDTYMEQFPKELWKDAKDKRETVEIRKWGTESHAWITASYNDTEEAYDKYLELYPRGIHHNIAEQRIIDFRVATFFRRGYSKLPALTKTSSGSGAVSKITATNNSNCKVVLMYSGPDSKRLILAPYETKSISLANGEYKIAASIYSDTFKGYIGTETLTGGGYKASYFFSTIKL